MPLYDWINSNLHNDNQDWIVGKIKSIEEAESNTKESAAAAAVSAEEAAASAAGAKTSELNASGSAASAAYNALQYSTVSSSLAALTSRMDEFTHLADGSTTGDAELADGRIEANGLTASNIGDAIRTQVRDLDATIQAMNEKIYMPYGPGYNTISLGGINTETGINTTNSARARSTTLNTSNRKAVSLTDANYQFQVLTYDSTGNSATGSGYLGKCTPTWVSAGVIVPIPESAAIIALMYRNSDNTTVTSAQAAGMRSSTLFYVTIDSTMTLEGVPADAAAVGRAIKAATPFYTTEGIELIGTTAGVIHEYDALSITKIMRTYNSTSIPEYTIDTGNWNIAGSRSRDAVIEKPLILITAGVHGYERSAVMSLLDGIRALAENDYQLRKIIKTCRFKIMPVINEYGYDNDSRLNENGVNINRNFATSDWTRTPEGADYSGASPADQAETKIVQDWINENDDASLLIDIHNSSITSEISCLIGSDTDHNRSVKYEYLKAISELIPWLQNKGISTGIYCYTGNTATPGTLKGYAQEAGIPAFTLELSWNIAGTGKHSQFTIARGAECIMNTLINMTL